MYKRSNTIAKTDATVWNAIVAENARQEEHIELIASENYASPAVMQAQGSQLTNKYAEGYPGKRYYGGCENVDVVETLAIERAKKIFCEPAGVEMAVNVQPHSGAQANSAVFLGLLEHGDTIMGLSLAEGGHLTHGMRLNFSGKYFNVVPYGLDADEKIDYDKVEALAKEHKPKLIIAGASAYSLHIDFKRFADIAHSVGAYFMVDMAHYAGLIAAGVYPTPFGHADIITTTTHKTLRGPRGGLIFSRSDLEKKINSAVFPGMQGGPELQKRGLRIVSGGTQSHVMLVDLRPLKITGKLAESALHEANITVNKNTIPNDPETPFVTSGIRLGSPAITTRGFGEAEARKVANLIVDVLEAPTDEAVLARVRAEVHELTSAFPVYQD